MEHPNTYLFCYSQYFYGGGTCYRHCFSEGWLLSVINLQFGFMGDTVLHQLSVFALHLPGITFLLKSVDCAVMGFFFFRFPVQVESRKVTNGNVVDCLCWSVCFFWSHLTGCRLISSYVLLWLESCFSSLLTVSCHLFFPCGDPFFSSICQ